MNAQDGSVTHGHVAHGSISRTQSRRLQRQRPSPSKFRLCNLGPGFAEHLKTSKTTFVECSHIRWIAVIKLLKNVMHHGPPTNDPDEELEEAQCDVKSLRPGKRELEW